MDGDTEEIHGVSYRGIDKNEEDEWETVPSLETCSESDKGAEGEETLKLMKGTGQRITEELMKIADVEIEALNIHVSNEELMNGEPVMVRYDNVMFELVLVFKKSVMILRDGMF